MRTSFLNISRVIGFSSILLVIVLAYQNCSPSFEVSKEASQLNSLSDPNLLNPPLIAFAPDAPTLFNSSVINLAFEVTVLGTSPLSSVTCQLNQEPTTDCASRSVSFPNLLDGDHSLKIVASTEAGARTELTRVFRKDTLLPVVNVSMTPSIITNQINTQFQFTTTDALSGVLTTECSLDNVAFAACTSPVQLSALTAGTHSFRIRATDRAGNVSLIFNHSWTIDLTAPTVLLSATPQALTNQTTASFAFAGAGIVSYECQLDNGTYAACTSPATYNNLAVGSHTFRVRGTNAATTVSAPVQYVWVVDTVAPSAPVITANVTALSNLRTASLSFVATDLNGVSTYQCSLDNAAFANCTSPVNLTNLNDGARSYRVRAIDGAGNISAVSTFSWTVDATAPALTFTQTPASSSQTTATVTFNVSDAGSGLALVQCSLNNAAFAACTSLVNLTNLSVQTHNFRVQARDNAGNSTLLTHTWAVSQAPAPPVNAGGCDQTLSAGANVGAALASATAGSTICLSSGNFPGFTLNNVSKSPPVTIRAVNAGGANFTGEIRITGSSSGVAFDGANYAGISITGASVSNLTFRNGDASKGTVLIDGVMTAAPNILFENLTHYNQDNTGFCSNSSVNCVGPAGYSFNYSGRSTPVATIRGATIDGGCADGIQSGVPFILENSRILNKQVGSCINDPHTDATQFYGGPFAGTVIRGNYYYRNVQVIGAYDGVDRVLIENNVFDPGPDGERRPCQIELYSDDGSIVRHNTLVSRGTLGSICLDRKAANRAGVGTVIVDNIAYSIETANGSVYSQRSNNLVRTGVIAGDISGTPTFTGGLFPTTYTGFGLAAGSPGKGAGRSPTGSDIGIIINSSNNPAWSLGRDSAGKLVANSGTLGNITFLSEVRGSYPNEGEISGCTPADRVAYDWSRDGYEGRPFGSCRTVGVCALENQDLGHPSWNTSALRHVLIKNWNLKNAFKTNPAPHVDVTQVLDSPGWGGWFVMQDSTLKNSDDGIVQFQFGYQGTGGCASVAGKARNEFGGVVLQNLTLGQEAAFVADCQARGTDGVCNQGNYMGSWNPGEGWLINYKTNDWFIILQQPWKKVVIVGNVPNLSFREGDAYSFSTQQSCTVGPCSFGGRVFGPYPSIEAAIAAGHAEPPFVRLSCSGWADPKNCVGGAPAP